MKNAIKKICAGVIVCAFAIGCSACCAVAERQKAKEIIREAEERVQAAGEENEKRKEQYQDLWEKVPTRPSIPLPEIIQPSEPLDMVPSDTDAFEANDEFYKQIIENYQSDRSNERHLRVGGSLTPAAAVSLMGFNRYVYSSNTNVVTVSEDGMITAVAPGEANVVIGDGTVYLVYFCFVTEE